LPINGKVPGNIVLKEHMDLEGNESVVVVSNKTDMRMNGRDVLKIRPRNLILGIGCKRGTTVEDIVTAVNDFLARNQRSILSLGTVATIDIKENEQGLLDYSRYKKIPLKLIQSDRIREVEDQYTSSGFVKANVGVSSVAEPCAVLAGKNARLICKKTIYHGITLALAEEEKVFKL
ncbi:MAG: cobalamin biosynthesis protein, partial [Clostridia bacterium]|nr:cobalamin biosynthesis protein [Clostridia bacterium]